VCTLSGVRTRLAEMDNPALDNLTLPVVPPLGVDAPGMSPSSESWYTNIDSPVYTEVWMRYKNQCFEMADQLASSGDSSERLAQVGCFAELLNLTDVPSVYDFSNFTAYYQPVGCMLANVTYEDRYRFPRVFHFCTVPGEAPDVFLFASLALLASCFLFGKLSTVWVLIAGCLLATLNFFVNLLQIGNSIALWLNIQPPDLFLYAFLPPLIVEQAIRIDFYMFKKNFVRSLMLSVVMVILTTLILTPLILYVLGFHDNGWTWVWAGLFSAVIAPTDALAVASVLKKSNGPAMLTNLLESESLLNDATGITLFQVFFDILQDNTISDSPSVWSVVPKIIKDIVVLTAIGFGLGLAFSLVALYSLKWLRWRGAGNYIEATFVLAMSYLVYWVTQSPCGGSGVIAVVTFGLFGNSTLQWGMTGSAFKSGDFDAMWDMVSFLANGLVFFWAGIASMSFLIPACSEVAKSALAYASVVLIYIFMLMIRTGCVALFNPIFHLIKSRMSAAEILFVGWCGLRGAVSLILLATLSSGSGNFSRVAGEALDGNGEMGTTGVINVKSDIALWTTTFIILTLVVNGPLIAPLMKSFGLMKISRAASKVQARAKAKILEHTATCIVKYQNDEDSAFLTGADWQSVAKYVDLEPSLRKFGRVKARKRISRQPKSFGGYVDPTSYISVFKAFFVTCWRWIKGLVLDVVLLKFWFKDGNLDMYETGSMYDDEGMEGLDGAEDDDGRDGGNGAGPRPPGGNEDGETSDEDGSAYDEGGFENECHFQTIERTITIPSGTTWDVEHGVSGNLGFLASPGGTGGACASIDSQSRSLDGLRHDRAAEDSNQVCLSGIAGKMLMKELMASQDAEAHHGPGSLSESSDPETETPKSLKYYSSLPASSAADLYDELKEALEKTRSSMVTPMMPEEEGERDGPPLSAITARKAEASRPTIQDLSAIFSAVNESVPESKPAFARRMSASFSVSPRDTPGAAASQQASHSGPGEGAPDSSRAMFSGHSYTVSGTSAKQLQRELLRSGGIRYDDFVPDGGDPHPQAKRDLLGNKQPSATEQGQKFELRFPGRQTVSRGVGNISHHLAMRSNLHQLKQESLASTSTSAAKLVKSTSISELADEVVDCSIPEEKAKAFSDLAQDAGEAGRRAEQRRGNMEDNEDEDEDHDENLDEIRSRMVAGLKRSFTKRRAEGKISLEAFRILDQTCQESIEARGKLQLWSALERNAQGGWFVKLTYDAAFATGRWFKQQRPWLKKFLHYPWEGSMTLFRKYVGRAVLISCEVAIEYTLALAVSQHVRWLKLHDEYFSALLDEIDEEAEKSHSFIIDREIEAPDTFRAIQSYRAAVIVLKDMQAYVENLVEAGVVSSTEAEMINEHIDEKLRKLELTGPVWRPAKFSDTMKSLRPFVGLDPKTLDWLWHMGLYQEYMPGQPFFMEDTPDGATGTGIFHVLSGVAKRIVYSRDDGTLLREDYLGVGSCFGVRRALGLATGRRATVVYATGNALGRGTVVFRLLQSDVDRILSLSKGGSPIMHEIITRWTKIAALNVLDGSWEALAAKLEVLLSRYAAARVSGRAESGPHDNEQGTSKGSRMERAVSLSDVMSGETFDVHHHAEAVPVPQKVIRARALSMAKEMTARLRRGFLSSEVKHLLRGDTIRQSTTIILLKGAVETLETHSTSSAPVESPAILPHLTQEENESLAGSFLQEGETKEGKGLGVEEDTVWRVMSITALALVFPE